MNIQQLPQHELARLREKAKEQAGSQFEYQEFYTVPASFLQVVQVHAAPLSFLREGYT